MQWHEFYGLDRAQSVPHTPLARRSLRCIKRNKVFENVAARGKPPIDWFFGFKLHLVVNDRGELLNIIDQLKNISQIEHSRHRSPVNCFVNILGGLIAYCHQSKKPAIGLDHNLLLPA